MKKTLTILLLIFATAIQAQDNMIATVASPDGKNVFNIYMVAGNKLQYEVYRNEQLVVGRSEMGFVTDVIDCTSGFYNRESYIKAEVEEIDETYELPTGKTHIYHNHCNELTLTMRRGTYKPQFVVRAYDDGVAFRYVFPGTGNITVSQDVATVVIPSFKCSWGQKYTSDYSQVYSKRDWAATQTVENDRFAAPVLVETTLGDDYNVLITEAAVNENFCGSPVYPSATVFGGFEWHIHSNATASNISATKPYKMPWRVLFIGSQKMLVESVMIDNLNEPTKLTDTSWIKAGLSSWDWGGEEGGGLKNRTDWDVARQYIDLAATMGWRYFTLDEGWSSSKLGENGTTEDYCRAITEYGESKGVKCIIWRNQSSVPSDEAGIRNTLQQWKDWGFVGAKIDFFTGDSQAQMQKQERILRIAAELQMMINFHGCTKPTGLRRTYPNYVTCEAVDGNEDYFTGTWNATGTDPNYNVTLALTRNVVGPMDYTPWEFAQGKNGRHRDNTTWGHQIALGVIYESGFQTVSDSYTNILSVINPNVTGMLKLIPAAWDETRCLDVQVDDHIAVARRDGTTWWIGYAADGARNAKVSLDFLPEGAKYRAYIYGDGSTFDTFSYSTRSVSSTSSINVPVLKGGGFVIRLVQTSAPDAIEEVKEEASTTITGSIYDLSGRKVKETKKGIYVTNGHKIAM